MLKNYPKNFWQAPLAGFTVLVTLAVIGLWALGYYIAAAIVGTATGALYLLLIVLATSHVTRRNTIETMERGAAIALRAQQLNDQWDAKKTTAMTTLVREGMRLASHSRLPTGAPSLPLPGQVSDWLQLPDPVEADYEELEDQTGPQQSQSN